MSGLFKNFERVVSNSVFNNPKHRYLVQYRLACFNPASQFFNRQTLETGLNQGHSYDLFSLAISSYNLLKQTQNYGDILANVSKESGTNSDFSNLQRELETSISRNNTFIQDALNDIILHLQSGNQSLPAQCAVGVATVLAQGGVFPAEKASQIFSQYLQPVLLEKIQYFSTQNYIDAFVALNQLGLANSSQAKPLWDALFNGFNRQTLEWEYQTLEYHGWETHVYETPETSASGQKNQSDSEFFSSDLEKYWIDLKNGNSLIAQFQRYLRCYWQWEQNNVIYPLFFREKRVNYQFDKRDVPYEQERLFNALKEIEKSFPDQVDAVRKRL